MLQTAEMTYGRVFTAPGVDFGFAQVMVQLTGGVLWK
jgi:hypothetical protein